MVTESSLLSDILAVIAIFLSSGTLGWTVYRDAIQKPRFRVSVRVMTSIGDDGEEYETIIQIRSVNLGPIPNRAGMVFLKNRWLRLKDRKKQAFVKFFADDPYSTPLNSRIEVGDEAMYMLPYNPGCFLAGDFDKVGIVDGFGRLHWAPSKDMKEARERYIEDFGSETS